MAELRAKAEVYKDKPIFYGVGNLIFNTRKEVGHYKDYRWYSYMADCLFENGKIAAIRIMPFIGNEVGVLGDYKDSARNQLHLQTRGFGVPVTGAEAAKVLHYIQVENQSSSVHDFSTALEIKGDFAYWPSKQVYDKSLLED